MKSFLAYITEAKKRKRKKKAPRFKGTPVLISHGSHSRPVKYKGTPVLVQHGSHSGLKKLTEKFTEPVPKFRSSGMPEPREYDSHADWLSHDDNDHLAAYWRGDDVPKPIDSHMEQSYPLDKVGEISKRAIKNYTQGSYSLNKRLHKDYVEGKETPDVIPVGNYSMHKISDIDAGVNHHRLEHDLHVYSGVPFHPGIEAAKDPENKIHLPAYTSTSTQKKVATEFAPKIAGNTHGKVHHILHIHLQPGQRGAYIGRHGLAGHEHEFLLPRNTTLKIHPTPSVVPPTEDGPDDEEAVPTHVWHSYVVPNEIDHRQQKLPLKHK